MTEQTIEQLRDELAQARDELAQTQIDKELAQQGHLIASQEAVDLRAARNALAKGRDRNLVQARTELKDLQGANRALGQQVARVRRNRDFWYNTCLAAEAERDQIRREAQEQSDEVQRDWLSPAEAEGLRRQLAQAVVAQADAELAAHVHDKACGELAQTAHTERALRQVAETSERASRKMLARQCDMARTAETEAMKAKRELAEAELAAHVLRESNFVLAQKVRTERVLRQDAEGHASSLRLMLVNISEILDEYGVEHYRLKDRDSEGMSTRERVRLLCQRAERAEALAALVTEETAAMLERLAGIVAGQSYHRTADRACALAAQIREALDDSQA